MFKKTRYGGAKLEIRTVKDSDYYVISPLINKWWGGRKMSDKLPKLFFDHFSNTSFIAEKDEKLIGFLIGVLSQSHQKVAYIHFVGVHPDYRKQSVGNHLYNQFFHVVQQNGRNIVRCVTSPVNKTSIAFHTKMGFCIEEGDKKMDGIFVNTDYEGPHEDRVLFEKRLI